LGNLLITKIIDLNYCSGLRDLSGHPQKLLTNVLLEYRVLGSKKRSQNIVFFILLEWIQ